MAQQVWTFADATGLTFDPMLIQVAAGVADLIGGGGFPPTLTAYAQYNTLGANFDLDFSGGAPAELLAPALTTVQAPVRVYGAGGLEDIADAAGPWGLAYAALGNADSGMEGTVEFFMRPSVLPLADPWPKDYAWITEAVGINNQVILSSETNGGAPPNAISLDVRDNGGFATAAGGFWGVVPNDLLFHHYSFGWNLNGVNGHRVAIDGIQQAGPASFAAVRNGAALDRLWFLRRSGADRRFHGYIDELSIYSTRIRNGNFVPPAAELGGVAFPTDNPDMVFQALSSNALNSFTPTIIPAAGADIRWAVRMRGWQYYFVNNLWAPIPIPQATSAHTCTTAEMITNIRYLRLLEAPEFVAYFTSDGTATAQLDNLVIDYVG